MKPHYKQKTLSGIITLPLLLLMIFGCGDTDFQTKDGSKSRKGPVIKSESTRPCNPKPPIGRIYFDCTIPNEHYEIIREDLELLLGLELRGSAALELQEMLHLSQLTGKSLFQWLEDRVQFVLDETYFASTPENVRGTNISNSKINLYRNPFATIEVPGYGSVIINSQRVGVIQLGPDFINELDRSLSSKIMRINTFLHEARHGDGRGDANGFPHSACPRDHQERGEVYACDTCTNGPHGISRLFIQSILDGWGANYTRTDQFELRVQLRVVTNNIFPSATVCDDSLEFI